MNAVLNAIDLLERRRALLLDNGHQEAAQDLSKAIALLRADMVDNPSIGLVPRSTDAWFDAARRECNNTAFYHDLVKEIGEMFGIIARISNDGSLQESVLALKVPDLVRSLVEARR